MKQFIFDGSDLCTENISGVSRYAFEVISNVDNLLGEKKYDNLNITLCYPKDVGIILPELRNITYKSLATNGGAFRTKVLKKYAKRNHSTICTFGPSICYSRNMIITIHDVRPVECKEYDSPNSRLFMKLVLLSCKLRGCQIVTDANYQKEQISKFGHISSSKIEVFGCGWEHIERVEPDYRIFNKYPEIVRGNYLYALGSVAKHKNYEWIYEVAKRNQSIQFVVAGNISKSVWGIDNSKYILNNIVFTGYVTDEENKALLSNCRAIMQPSKYEGFGLPPLEALVLGKKALVSNVTCLPEIYQGYVSLFSPSDYIVNLNDLLNQKVESPKKLIEKFSWRKVAKSWLDLMLVRELY